jgi:hypothetical protein
MSEPRPHDRNVEGILHYMHDYLSVREQQAIRINARIANIIDDIVWSQVANLRIVLEKQKMFGPERIRMADVLVGDDDLKRKALFSHSDQNSIIFEIINKSDEQKRAMAELAIHNLRTFFRALDPSLEMIVELIQHWLLWDLPDAADLHHFDEQLRRLHTLESAPISEDLRNRFRTALHRRPDEPMTNAEILQIELKRLGAIVARVSTRRAEEEAYMMIIRRDEQPYSASNQAIVKLSKHLKTIELLEKTAGELDPQMAEEYSRLLLCKPESVTKEAVVEYEKKVLADGKKSLENFLKDDRYLGEPYDYKKTQAQQLRDRLAAEQKRIDEYVLANPDPGGDAAGAGVSQGAVSG